MSGKTVNRPKIKVRQSAKNSATRFGGSAVLIKYLGDILGFRRRFSVVTLKKGKNSRFTTVDMLFALLALIMLGCDRISHINDRFGDEELLARQLGISRIFDQSTAHRFLNRFGKWHTRQLERIILCLIRDRRSHEGATEKTVLDIDASDLTRESHKTGGAKPGRNKKNKGKDSYLISCGFADNQVVATDFRSGNAHCSQALKAVFDKAAAALGNICMIRLDAGYISAEVLKWVLELTTGPASADKIRFLIACNGQAKGIEDAGAYARRHPEKWIPYKKGEKNISVMNFNDVRLFDKYPEGRVRIVLVRMNQKVKKCKNNKVRYHTKTRIYAIATNLTRGYGPRQIFRLYHQRQTIELMFRELKNSFCVGKLPSGKMNANYAYFLLCCLAYNSAYCFRRDCIPPAYRNISMSTVRRRFLEIPAIRRDVWDVIFNLGYRYFRVYEQIVSNVQKLIPDVNHAKSAG